MSVDELTPSWRDLGKLIAFLVLVVGGVVTITTKQENIDTRLKSVERLLQGMQMVTADRYTASQAKTDQESQLRYNLRFQQLLDRFNDRLISLEVDTRLRKERHPLP
jgi:hypothetical protein